MLFAIHMTCFLVSIGGLGHVAFLLDMPNQWLVVTGTIAVGLALLTSIKMNDQKDLFRT